MPRDVRLEAFSRRRRSELGQGTAECPRLVRHSVEVLAEGLYEAAVLGLSAFKKLDF